MKANYQHVKGGLQGTETQLSLDQENRASQHRHVCGAGGERACVLPSVPAESLARVSVISYWGIIGENETN